MSELLEGSLDEARNEVRQVREWLLRPTAGTMGACGPALERAAGYMRELARVSQPARGISHGKATQLAEEIRDTQVLLIAAGELYLGAMRRWTASEPNATAPHAAVMDPPAQPLSVTG